ncbi:hypothetical protein HAX54_016556, partial [Datura stramonium]|nr:hypothetical protein [Datura stramonium]
MQNAYEGILHFQSDMMPIGDYVDAYRVILESNILRTSRLPKEPTGAQDTTIGAKWAQDTYTRALCDHAYAKEATYRVTNYLSRLCTYTYCLLLK